MTQLYSDSYFDNIQLVKMVSSAEALFQHLYDLVSYENRQFIDQWLCFKHEYDSCSSPKLDLNIKENDDIICKDEEELYSSNESYQSSVKETTSDDGDQSSDEISDQNLLSSGFESGSQNLLEEYSKNFKIYTETIVSGWLHNLNLDTIENSSGDHITSPNTTHRGHISTPHELNFAGNVSCNPVLHPNGEISSLRFCHCCANETVNCYSILLLPVEEQISYLRDIKTPLIQACQKISSHCKRGEFGNKTDKELIMLQEIIELIDISIEMKNNDQIADLEMKNLLQTNYLIYSSIFNCLKMLSSNEIHYLFLCFINKIISLRDNSSTLDKLILQLDNTIVDKEIRLRYLNKNYIKLRDICESLQNESKRLSCKAPFNEQPDRVTKASNNQSLPGSRNSETTNSSKDSSSSSPTNIPIRKGLKSESSSKTFDVTRKGNKVIIQRNKDS